MGSRGAFVNVDAGNFSFVSGGKNYNAVGALSSDSNVKILLQAAGSVKAPEYSHTAGRVYAIVQNGRLKHLTYYDERHKQSVSIDLTIAHEGKLPHRHFYLNTQEAHDITPDEADLIARIKKEYKLK